MEQWRRGGGDDGGSDDGGKTVVATVVVAMSVAGGDGSREDQHITMCMLVHIPCFGPTRTSTTKKKRSGGRKHESRLFITCQIIVQ